MPVEQQGWSWTTIEEAGEVRLGRQRSPKDHDGENMVPYLRVANVFENSIDLTNVKEMNFTPEEQEIYRLNPGDILLNEGQSPHLVGRPAMYRGEPQPCFFQNTLIRFRAHPHVLPGWALLVFRAQLHARRYMKLVTNTTNIAHLSAGRFAKVEFPLPPSDSQKAMVSALELHEARIDDAEASLRRAKVNVRRARASVLKAAVEGRLVPTEAALAHSEGRDYEPASALLARILAERHVRWKEGGQRGKYKAPVPPERKDLGSLPDGWTWVTVDQASWASSYGTSVKCDTNAAGPPVLRIPNVQGGSIDMSNLKSATDALGLKPGEAVEPGDLLFVRTNGSLRLIGLAATALFPLPSATWFASYLIRFRLVGTSYFWRWVNLVWNGPVVREYIERDAASSAGQYNVSLSAAARYMIPLPPLAEQRRIVVEVDRRVSVLDAIETTLGANLARCARLRQSILKRAFEGRLVPPEPVARGEAKLSLSPQKAAR